LLKWKLYWNGVDQRRCHRRSKFRHLSCIVLISEMGSRSLCRMPLWAIKKFFLVVLEFELRVSHLLGKFLLCEPWPQPFFLL
jgi:hypothetical protein